MLVVGVLGGELDAVSVGVVAAVVLLVMGS